MKVGRWFMIAALLAAGSLSLAACGGAGTGTVDPGAAADFDGDIIYAVNREPDTMDMHVGSSRYAGVVASNVFATIVEFDPETGEFLPWLAEEVTISDDARVYTIKLRDGIIFHDGTPVNAAAIQFNFDRIVDPATVSTSAIGQMGDYSHTEIVDDLTVHVHFNRAHPDFWFALASTRVGGLHSPAALEDPERFITHPVGAGPFKMVEWTERDRVVLERWDDFDWPSPTSTHSGPARPKRVIFRLMEEGSARVTALRTGEVDIIMTTPGQFVSELQSNSDTNVLSEVLPGSGVIQMVNASKSPTDDIRVRRAFQHLHDQDEIARVGYLGAAPPHRGSVLSEPNIGFIDVSDMYPFDIDRAAELLDEAGWSGTDTRTKDGNRLETLFIGFPGEETTRVQELIQSHARKVGWDHSIMELDTGAIQQARQEGVHHTAHLTFIYPMPGFLTTLFHTDGIGTGWNFTHHRDSELDALLEEAEFESNLDRRLELYAEIQRHILDQAVVLPNVYQHQTNAFRSNVHGLRMDNLAKEPPILYEVYKTE